MQLDNKCGISHESTELSQYTLSPKGTRVSSSHANLTEQKKVGHIKTELPQDWLMYTNMSAVQLLWNTNMAAMTPSAYECDKSDIPCRITRECFMVISNAIEVSNRALFPCLHRLIWTQGEFGEFETVMQLRDVVEGLHNFREFSQTSECKDEAL